MSKQDGRYLSPNVQDYLRQQAMRLREQGKTFGQIADFLGVHRDTVSRWWQQYQSGGEAALSQQPRGRKPGDGSKLTPQQGETLQQMLREYYPDELGIDSSLWTRRAVQALIAQHYQIEMPIRTVGDYLKAWGFTPQKPSKRFYQQEDEAVVKWLLEEYPDIEQLAQQEGAEIQWGDQAGLNLKGQRGRGYAPIGETPTQKVESLRGQINYMASITNQGLVRFKLYDRRFNSEILIEFMTRLIAESNRKIFLILDNHPVHKADMVQLWIDEHVAQIEMFFLPRYSPELNPAEYLNCDVKQEVHTKAPTRSLKLLKERTRKALHKLQRLPQRITRYFQHGDIDYAAAS
jgi:transposase